MGDSGRITEYDELGDWKLYRITQNGDDRFLYAASDPVRALREHLTTAGEDALTNPGEGLEIVLIGGAEGITLTLDEYDRRYPESWYEEDEGIRLSATAAEFAAHAEKENNDKPGAINVSCPIDYA